jgi:hypothetical protein
MYVPERDRVKIDRNLAQSLRAEVDPALQLTPPARTLRARMWRERSHATITVARRAPTKGFDMLIVLGRRHTATVVRRCTIAVLACCALVFTARVVRAQDDKLPPVSVGAGVRSAFIHTSPPTGDSTDAFVLDSVRLYVSGSAAKNVKFMFNTEYDSNNHINVLDAAAQFEISPMVNFWVGRFLPPSDRANMYGPYYAPHWGVFADGVQDGYPFVSAGRDNGAMYWGQFGKVKLSGGGFDGASATGSRKLIAAGRAQVDFWDPEGGYYLNGTYYGAKNLLAVGVAGQAQSKEAGDTSDGTRNAWSVDFLLEKKVGQGAAFTIESEFAKYSRLGGYNSRYNTDQGGYVLASYLFPPMMGLQGKWEILGKFAKANFSNGLRVFDADYSQKTSEVNLNYLIKEFNARVMIFYKDTRFNAVQVDNKQVGVGIQLQM